MDASWDSFLTSNGVQPGQSGGLQAVLNGASGALALAGPVGSAAAGLLQTAATVSQLFGKGHKEADIIVPIQNQYGQLLTVVNQQMTGGALTRDQLIQYQLLVANGYAEFDHFTRNPQFTDGRASVQARNTIRPLVDGRNDAGQVVRADGGTLGNLQTMIDARGGGGYYAPLPGGGIVPISSPGATGGLPGFSAGGAFVAPTPRAAAAQGSAGSGSGDSALLLGGAALIGAKLLGLL